jgi:flagellar biosynthesis protein
MSKSNSSSPTNPNQKSDSSLHVAALKYDVNKDNAPYIVAAGSGPVAQRILDLGAEHGIALYYDDSAATLLSKLDCGEKIPPELYQIVVNIYLSLLNLAEENIPEELESSE